MKVHVRFYALFREHAGVSEKFVETQASTARELFAQLELPLSAHLTKVAINGRMASLNDAISDGDEVVFLPPVAGG